MSRRRWRTAGLWVGCTLCVLIAAAFVVSGWWRLTLASQTFGPVLDVARGGFGLRIDSAWWGTTILEKRSRFNVGYPVLEWWNLWRVTGPIVAAPLYAAFLAVSVPTFLVWRFVPRFPRGHCRRCGYNLKGLTEARCPECGTGFGRDTLEAGRCR